MQKYLYISEKEKEREKSCATARHTFNMIKAQINFNSIVIILIISISSSQRPNLRFVFQCAFCAMHVHIFHNAIVRSIVLKTKDKNQITTAQSYSNGTLFARFYAIFHFFFLQLAEKINAFFFFFFNFVTMVMLILFRERLIHEIILNMYSR